MSEIVEFLRIRLDEDERVARAAIAGDCGQDGGFEDADWLTDPSRVRPSFGDAAADLIRTFAVPARVLREVEAKRLLIEFWSRAFGKGSDFPGVDWDRVRSSAQWTLRLLAVPYADHEDYDESWRP